MFRQWSSRDNHFRFDTRWHTPLAADSSFWVTASSCCPEPHRVLYVERACAHTRSSPRGKLRRVLLGLGRVSLTRRRLLLTPKRAFVRSKRAHLRSKDAFLSLTGTFLWPNRMFLRPEHVFLRPEHALSGQSTCSPGARMRSPRRRARLLRAGARVLWPEHVFSGRRTCSPGWRTCALSREHVLSGLENVFLSLRNVLSGRSTSGSASPSRPAYDVASMRRPALSRELETHVANVEVARTRPPWSSPREPSVRASATDASSEPTGRSIRELHDGAGAVSVARVAPVSMGAVHDDVVRIELARRDDGWGPAALRRPHDVPDGRRAFV